MSKKWPGVSTTDGREFLSGQVILATGHSARDIYEQLHTQKVQLEQTPFAVGVRIEHPQAQIDSLQYHTPLGQERPALLPAASYRLAYEDRQPRCPLFLHVSRWLYRAGCHGERRGGR
jgi:uncharacterized FAD-dependent dehydrogenase